MTQTLETPKTTNGDNLPARRDQQPHAMTLGIGEKGIKLNTFADVWSAAQIIIKAGMAPKGLETIEKVAVALLQGREIGLSVMASLRAIGVINGRPSIYGDAALALVRGSGKLEYFLELPSNNVVYSLILMLEAKLEAEDKEAVKKIREQIATATAQLDRAADDYGYTVISKREHAITSTTTRFTMADAKKAKLWGKQGPWTEYPDRMLKFRARGFNLRDNFGDVLNGMVTAEEAGDLPPEPRQVESVTIDSRSFANQFAAAGLPENPVPQFPGSQAADPFGQPVTIPPLPSEAEAEKIIEDAAQQTRQNDLQNHAAPGSDVIEEHASDSADGDESQVDEFADFKSNALEVCKARGKTPAYFAGGWVRMLKEKKLKTSEERNLTLDDQKEILQACAEGTRWFA